MANGLLLDAGVLMRMARDPHNAVRERIVAVKEKGFE